MKRRFKAKKTRKFKYKTVLFILLSLLVLYYVDKNIKIDLSNNEIISELFDSSNSYAYVDKKNNILPLSIYNYIKKNIFNTPINLLKNEVDYDSDEVVNFTYVEKKLPSIYIYNSHQGETYSVEYLENYNIVPDVIMASNMLKDKLQDLGIESIVEDSDFLTYMKENNLNHGDSYKVSRMSLKKILNKYPNMDLYIDLHRDAISHSYSTITINDKPCAKVLFVIGLEYSTYQNNLEIVNKINNIIDSKYPGLSRGIMKKEGYGVNGVYNQDLASNVILIEIGGNENNIEEVNNTLDLIAIVLKEYIDEKEKY